MPTPFTIAVPDADIADLKSRLAATRFPKTIDGVGWGDGTDASFLRRFIDYWGRDYDWRSAEARLNAFPQFTEVIDGETVHFVQVKGRGTTNVPILLTNGWPSNFVELLPLVPLLTEPVDGVAFDVVIPSLPGYGFSSQPTRPGMNLTRVAALMAELMTRLDHDRFLVSGSDLGSGAEMALVRDHPERIIGAHYLNVYFGYPRPADPTPEEQAYFGKVDYWGFAEGAYAMVHMTKPASLAVGLNDSPAGLASWALEHFHKSGDTGGDILNAFELDDLCTILSVYWFTQTIGSSVRLYKEAFADPELSRKAPKHSVPHAILLLPADNPAPRAWGERNLWNIVRWTELSSGGHFPALEETEAMAHDIRAFHGQIS
ncbi:epoxide hydrolase family protein [Devosia sp. SL43]|uniref:epoxide hydrolase family protein n=1 Tax=Devosia sp. SL43 TaxID=2806348 RepID=UPI001F169D7F|nr:epoxide hydrolase family protein [Devosia sp. SL43]UJW84392.1 epoxide hydrolase [Devosia sp. SL43]